MRPPASFLLVPLAGEGAARFLRANAVPPPEAFRVAGTGVPRHLPGSPRVTVAPLALEAGGPPVEREAYGARVYARAAAAAVRIEGPERPVDLRV